MSDQFLDELIKLLSRPVCEICVVEQRLKERLPPPYWHCPHQEEE